MSFFKSQIRAGQGRPKESAIRCGVQINLEVGTEVQSLGTLWSFRIYFDFIFQDTFSHLVSKRDHKEREKALVLRELGREIGFQRWKRMSSFCDVYS